MVSSTLKLASTKRAWLRVALVSPVKKCLTRSSTDQVLSVTRTMPRQDTARTATSK